MARKLGSFQPGSGFTIFRTFRVGTWFVFQHFLFKAWFFPTRIRPIALRAWGAEIGKDVLIRRGVKVHFPWNLSIGDDCWIGEEVWFINHEKVILGSDVCISQRSIICSGGHDYRSASLAYQHKPIRIKNGAWLCLDTKVLPGVTIGECSVLSAGEVARKSLPDFSLLIDGNIREIQVPK